MSTQLSLWDAQVSVQRPPLGSTFRTEAEGTNPCMFLGKVGSNYYPGMNLWDELFYWTVIHAWRENGRIAMTCKVIGYHGNGHHLDEGDEEDEDC